MTTHFIQQQSNCTSPSTSIVNFIPLDKIGQGSFSSVYKVRRITDDCIYALKKIKIASLKQKQKQNALNQIRLLASLNSQYIIQYREAFFDHKLNLLCIVMQFANEGDLQKKIQSYRKLNKHIPQAEVWKASYHVLKGLDILHRKNILHRDIKSANIFINNGVYKVGDLNVSKVQNLFQKMAYTQTGTPYYASPQVWRDQPYDFKSDIWSLGCVLYQMCAYRPPFQGKDLQSLYKNVQKGVFQPLPICYSKQLSDLISSCLRLNSKHRLSAKQILSSPIIKQKCLQITIQFEDDQFNDQLLKTIKLPNDLKELKKKLPKSKYSHSIDNIIQKQKYNSQNVTKQQNKSNNNNKFLQIDHYLKLAHLKKQQSYLNSIKFNYIHSDNLPDKNPQEDKLSLHHPPPPHIKQIKSCKLITNYKKLSKNHSINQNKFTNTKPIESPQQDLNSISQKKTSIKKQPSTQTYKSNKNKQQKQDNIHNPNQNNNNNSNNTNTLIKNQLRKLSHGSQVSSKSGKALISPISLIKKLSHPTSVGKCLSQRNLQNQLQQLITKQNDYQTQRLQRYDKYPKNQPTQQNNQQLDQIEKKISEKRKQLRKIGSIQRLQAGSCKNIHHLGYRPYPFVLHPINKKSVVNSLSMQMKSPTSTQDQSSYIRLNQRVSSQKKLILNSQKSQLNKLNTPYMMGISQAPRMKRILEHLNQSKKVRDPDFKRKIMSHKYLYKY